MNHNKTAILFFTRSAAAEAENKTWDTRFEINKGVAQLLIENTREILASTGMDVIELNENLQEGSSFGDKIINAFQFGFQRGYNRILLVGNDSVGLRKSDFFDAEALLKETPYVFGPNFRGGIYLIGFERDYFNAHREQIEVLPWSTSLLWKACQNRFEEAPEKSLRKLKDLDTEEDIRVFIQLVKSTFAKKLQELLKRKDLGAIRVLPREFKAFRSIHDCLRGPPLIVSK